MPREDGVTWKSSYFPNIIPLPDGHPNCFIVGADKVGLGRTQQIRVCLRGTAAGLTRENTIGGRLQDNRALEKLLPHIGGNAGFVFTQEDLPEIRDMLLANKGPAAAPAGAIAPWEVTVPAQDTGLGLEKTSFFQALGIIAKTPRGPTELLSDVQPIKTGDKVGASEATLRITLNISRSALGLTIRQVFENGSPYIPEVPPITEEALPSRLLEGVRRLASACLRIGYPAVASAPRPTVSGNKQVLALSGEAGYAFPLAEKAKAFLADPSAFATAGPVATATTAAPAAAAALEAKEELAESEEDMGFGLFD